MTILISQQFPISAAELPGNTPCHNLFLIYIKRNCAQFVSNIESVRKNGTLLCTSGKKLGQNPEIALCYRQGRRQKNF